MEFVSFAFKLENMRLHIFRLESEGKRPADAGVEDIVGKRSTVAERGPVMPQTVLLRSKLSPPRELERLFAG